MIYFASKSLLTYLEETSSEYLHIYTRYRDASRVYILFFLLEMLFAKHTVLPHLIGRTT